MYLYTILLEAHLIFVYTQCTEELIDDENDPMFMDISPEDKSGIFYVMYMYSYLFI